MGSALSLASGIDGLVTLIAIFAALGLCALFAIPLFFLLVLTVPALRDAFNKKGKDENGDYASQKTLLFYYVPALGALVSGLNIPLQSLKDAITSFANLASLDFVRLLILFLLSAFAALWLAEHDVIITAYDTLYTCEPVYSIRHVILGTH